MGELVRLASAEIVRATRIEEVARAAWWPIRKSLLDSGTVPESDPFIEENLHPAMRLAAAAGLESGIRLFAEWLFERDQNWPAQVLRSSPPSS